jgi:hypothetical protein
MRTLVFLMILSVVAPLAWLACWPSSWWPHCFQSPTYQDLVLLKLRQEREER